MTAVEFWACFDVYCKSKGIDADKPSASDLHDLMDKYGERSGSIKSVSKA